MGGAWGTEAPCPTGNGEPLSRLGEGAIKWVCVAARFLQSLFWEAAAHVQMRTREGLDLEGGCGVGVGAYHRRTQEVTGYTWGWEVSE